MHSATQHAGQAIYKLVVVLATLCVVLAAMAGRLWFRAEAVSVGTAPARVVADFVAAGNGLWDSHPDADVARVLQPGLRNRNDNGIVVSSNSFGMREREYVLPKPAGTVRVVLLGDSFVFGMGVAADQRVGVHLERLLSERCGKSPVPPIEVLHLGVTSWNAVAECAYLRRQLSLLRPDLVLQMIVPNDLDDTVGVRGVGLLSRSVPRHPEQADAVVSMVFGRRELDPESRGLLGWGMDDESRGRLQEAASDIQQLAQAVRATGGRFLLIINWRDFAAVAKESFAARLPPDEVCYLPTSFYRDERYRLSAQDEHWNPAGHEQVARFLYGLIVEGGLLPAVSPAAWDEAAVLARELNEAGHREAGRTSALPKLRESTRAAAALDLSQITPTSAGQVNGGVSRDGLVAPYASVLLARDGGSNLHIVGRCLSRPELDGAQVDVFVDADKVGEIVLAADARIDLRKQLPAAALAREWVTVRLKASDFVYVGADLRQCAVFRIQQLAIEP